MLARVYLLTPNGEPLIGWTNGLTFNTNITSLLVHDIRGAGNASLLVGTVDRRVIAVTQDGRQQWEATISGSVDYLAGLRREDNGRVAILAGTQTRQLHLLSNKGEDAVRATYFQAITSLTSLSQGGSTVPLALTVADGTMWGLQNDGTPSWMLDLNSPPLLSTAANDNILVVTDDNTLLNVATQSNDADIRWSLTDLGRVTAVYWGDLDNDGLEDIAVGNREGNVRLFTGTRGDEWDSLALGSTVFHMAGSSATSTPQLS